MPTPRDMLTIAWQLSPLQRTSPELGSLRRMVADEASRVFASVTDCETEAESGHAVGDGWILLCGPGDVYIGQRSLTCMRRAVAAAGSGAAPVRISELTPAVGTFYSLAGYERIEASLLGQRAGALGSSQASVPAALMVGAADLADACGDRVLDDWLAGRLDMARVARQITWSPAGLCHEFVDYYGNVRDEVFDLLPAAAQDVLEVGCGQGHTGALLQRVRGCRVTGVELSEEAARDAAGRLERVIHGDVLEVDLGGPYDAILLLDVLEHVADAEALLHRLVELLAADGRIIISLPNVGHHSVVQDLLAGRWDYIPIGLLCYTHLRFFTRTTLETWLRRSGLKIVEMLPQRTALPDRFRRLSRELEVDVDSLATAGFHVVAKAVRAPDRATPRLSQIQNDSVDSSAGMRSVALRNMYPKTCLVIPCFNEASRLDFDQLAQLPKTVICILVDDGSTDETGTLARRHASETLHVLELFKNVGKAEAVRNGILHARAAHLLDDVDWVGYWDADFATPLTELDRFLAYGELVDGGVEAVFGSRVRRLGSTIGGSHRRHLLGRAFAAISGAMLNLDCYDSQCGAKLFRSHLVEEAFGEPFTSRWIFDLEVLLRLRGRRLVEYPLVEWIDRPGSKINLLKVGVPTLVDLLRIRHRYRRTSRDRTGR